MSHRNCGCDSGWRTSGRSAPLPAQKTAHFCPHHIRVLHGFTRPTAGPDRRPARPSARRLRCPPRAPGARKRGAASSQPRVFLEITPHTGCPFPVNPGGGLAGSVRLARCTVGCGAPAQADAREVAPLCVAALRACPWLSDIDRARLSDERLAVRVALCGSCRERFAARRVREYVSSDVSLCTSYQS